MAFVLSNEGEKLLLDAAVGKVAAGNLKLKLFQNNVTPGHADTTATFTVATFTGYTTVTLTTSSWNAGVAGTGTGTALANKASIDYAQQTFTMGTPGTTNTIYGYYITDNAETTLLGAEKFSTAKSMAVSGDAIKITPKLTLSTE
ncbi:MAG: hypothetical protein QG602_3445 [Verrucomicrobiota bacterium]|nr:hypothetical protein [Verrucomicrobiota bacterium]